MPDKNQFVLFACCFPVKGFKQSIIVDVQRKTYLPIPNNIYDSWVSNKSINTEVVDKEWIELLEEKEFGFWTKNSKDFPEIKLEWKSSQVINNAILDISEHSSHITQNLFDQLDLLGCEAIQVRIISPISKVRLYEYLKFSNDLRIRNIELILPFSTELSKDSELDNLIREFKRITFVALFNSPEDKISTYYHDINVLFTTQKIESFKTSCGNISKNYFSYTLSTFTESQNFNTCLNRKISVDEFGDIKNCPSMNVSFGNISDTQLSDVIENKAFKKYWKIKKDEIKICRDCEFRHICTDCRAIIDDPNDDYSHPAKCKYNPYVAKWESEEGYIPVSSMDEKEIIRLKQKSIKH